MYAVIGGEEDLFSHRDEVFGGRRNGPWVDVFDEDDLLGSWKIEPDLRVVSLVGCRENQKAPDLREAIVVPRDPGPEGIARWVG